MSEAERTGASGAQGEISYRLYEGEHQLPFIDELMRKDLSEPYSIYTYRFFLHEKRCVSWLAYAEKEVVGAVVCRITDDRPPTAPRGYIAMLAVHPDYRKRGIGSALVVHAVGSMKKYGCVEAYLETESTNQGALRLYLHLGFIKDKLLARYYLNGNDAFRLKLLISPPDSTLCISR